MILMSKSDAIRRIHRHFFTYYSKKIIEKSKSNPSLSYIKRKQNVEYRKSQARRLTENHYKVSRQALVSRNM